MHALRQKFWSMIIELEVFSMLICILNLECSILLYMHFTHPVVIGFGIVIAKCLESWCFDVYMKQTSLSGTAKKPKVPMASVFGNDSDEE